MRATLVALVILCFLTPSIGAEAAAPEFVSVDFVLGVPVGRVPGLDPWPTLRVEYDLPPSPWGWELSYAFRGKQYYSFDHKRDQWSAPMPWLLMDAEGVSEADWPFFQTRHVLSPGLVLRLEKSWVQPLLSLGLLAQFFLPAEAEEFYPEYKAEFLRHRGRVQTILGNYLKFGLEGRLFPWMTWGTDFVFEIPSWSDFYTAIQTYPAAYAQSNAHFEVRVGGRW